LDGTNGGILHACQVEQPITSIVVLRNNLMTAHVGNVMKVWSHDPDKLAFDCNVRVNNAPFMESESEAEQGNPARPRNMSERLFCFETLETRCRSLRCWDTMMMLIL